MVDVAIVRFTKATHTAEVFTPGGSLADTAITQFVWCKTHAVGCAVATDPRREVWVCNYDPPGNVIGYRPY